MGKFKDWIKKMSLKDKIKNIFLIVLSGAVTVFLLIFRGKASSNRVGQSGFNKNYTDLRSSYDRERERLDTINSGLKSSTSRADSIKHRIDATRKSVSDVIKSAQDRNEK